MTIWPGNTLPVSLEENANVTTIHLTFSGDILDEAKDIADWRDYYFEPIRKLLEQ